MLWAMRAWLLDRPGPPGSMRLTEIDSPWRSPVADRREVEVLVKVEAVGLNPTDFKTAAAGHPAWHYPQVPGLDVAGRVVAVHAEAAYELGQSGGGGAFGGVGQHTLRSKEEVSA